MLNLVLLSQRWVLAADRVHALLLPLSALERAGCRYHEMLPRNKG